jgi:hypothetical protein
MTVQITDPSGTVVDEIALEHGTAAQMTSPAVGNRLRSDADALGEIVAEYVASRTAPAK